MERRSSLPLINPNERMKFHLRKRKFSTNDLDLDKNLNLTPQEIAQHFRRHLQISPELPLQFGQNPSHKTEAGVLEHHHLSQHPHDHSAHHDDGNQDQENESEKRSNDLTSTKSAQSHKNQHLHSNLVSHAPIHDDANKSVIQITEEHVLHSARAKASKPGECFPTDCFSF
jgi:hypothetical protein